MKDTKAIILSGVTGATKGATVAGASAILSGIAMASVPIKFLGFITVGASTVVSAPVVMTLGVAGAIVGGTAAAVANYLKQSRIEKEFEDMIRSVDDSK